MMEKISRIFKIFKKMLCGLNKKYCLYRDKLQIECCFFVVFHIIIIPSILIFINSSNYPLTLPLFFFIWSGFMIFAFAKEKNRIIEYTKISIWSVFVSFLLVYILYFIEKGKFLQKTILDAEFTLIFFSIILINLFFSLFLVFIWKTKEEFFKSIKGNKWKNVVYFNAMFWGYSLWFSVILYNILDCLCATSCCNTDQITYWDLYYSSLSTLTTLGIGDIVPCGSCRLLAGIEAFIGFFLISIIAGIIVSKIITFSRNGGD